ncbi:MAG: helix-turn-helix transcriptional regulator [Lawsonibacter sp.]|nr:helix-turn-helix transcriptional regulator [Lawsonibacter sp.]
MSLGNSLFRARKKSGLSQEAVAERLGISRQTVSKWELDETLPDICQSRKLSALYHVTLDELIDFDLEVKEIEEAIDRTNEETQKQIDWTRMWARKYPILASYQQEVAVEEYAAQLRGQLDRLRREHGYSGVDAFLVLKDILGRLWTEEQKGAAR